MSSQFRRRLAADSEVAVKLLPEYHLTQTTRSSGSRAGFISLVAAIMSLNALAIDVMLPALPDIGEQLQVTSDNQRQFVISVYMLGFGCGQLIIGPLSDRFGRRRPLLVGMSLYAAAAAAAALSPDFVTLLFFRFVQGIGAASTRVIGTSVVRDRYSGQAMAEIMSLTFMVFMAVPILAPSIGQLLLLAGPWQTIFFFMAALALVFAAWAFFQLPESLEPADRRPLTTKSVFTGFWFVLSSRVAFFYALAGTFLFSALFGFVSSAQQIYVGIYGLGAWFPAAFASVAGLMAISSFLNSKIVSRYGVRHISHFAVLTFTLISGVLLASSLLGLMPLWLFLPLLGSIMFMFGWAAANMNSLAMEPLGAVAGTASSVFGFTQTVGGALFGGYVGQHFDGTVVPVAAGYFTFGTLAVICVLIAEDGHLFGAGKSTALPDHKQHSSGQAAE